jgi:hypothetical protein
MLHDLFKSEGFDCEAIKVHERKIENRAREITMNRLIKTTCLAAPFIYLSMKVIISSFTSLACRRWIQGVFSNLNSKDAEDVKISGTCI